MKDTRSFPMTITKYWFIEKKNYCYHGETHYLGKLWNSKYMTQSNVPSSLTASFKAAKALQDSEDQRVSCNQVRCRIKM